MLSFMDGAPQQVLAGSLPYRGGVGQRGMDSVRPRISHARAPLVSGLTGEIILL
jgi:hypothetical protein